MTMFLSGVLLILLVMFLKTSHGHEPCSEKPKQWRIPQSCGLYEQVRQLSRILPWTAVLTSHLFACFDPIQMPGHNFQCQCLGLSSAWLAACPHSCGIRMFF